MALDPVCKMQVDEKKAAATSAYKGTTYYFCAPGCKWLARGPVFTRIWAGFTLAFGLRLAYAVVP